MRTSSRLGWIPVAAALTLVGCGGGSSGGGSSSSEPPPATPQPVVLHLPSGYTGLAAGTLTIPAGQTVRRGNVRFTCSSTTDCTVELSSSLGTLTATSIGRVTAMTTSVGGPTNPTAPETADRGIRAKGTNEQIRNASGIAILDWREASRQNTPTGPLPPLPNDRRGEPLHAATSAMGGASPTSEGTTGRLRDSITQSSTVHAADMTVGVGATYRLDGSPAGNSDIYESSAERTTTFTVQGVWRTPDGESDEWISSRTMTRADEENGLFHTMSWEDPSPVGPGGRNLLISLHTDIHNTKRANSYLLAGFTQDRDAGDGDDRLREGSMHIDWRSGVSGERTFVDPNIIRFDSQEMEFMNGLTTPHGIARAEFRFGDGAAGTYRGIDGIFFCTTPDGCHIRNEVVAEGVTVRGDFEFRPVKIEGGVEVYNGEREHSQAPTRAASMPTRGGTGSTVGRGITRVESGQLLTDPDWLAFGTWRAVPNDVHGDYEVGAFADGNDPFIAANVQALQGSATYTGRAFGEYARVLPADSSRAQRGTFTAAASLRANFDGGPTGLGVISGRVNGFEITPEGGSSVGSLAWDLRLENADIGRPNPLDGDPGPHNAFESDTSGFADGHAIEGRWGGRFFGNPRDDYGVLTNDLTAHPGSVAGTFGAAMKDGPAPNNYDLNLIGAFGAHRGTHR